MTDLTDLIARVEAGEGADRAIDKAVYEALGFCNHKRTKYYCVEDGNDTDSGFTCLDCGKDTYGAKKAPTYTASLDAVMALAPEGSRFAVTDIRGGDPETWDESASSGVVAFKDRRQFFAEATSPARALLAAILRAKAGV